MSSPGFSGPSRRSKTLTRAGFNRAVRLGELVLCTLLVTRFAPAATIEVNLGVFSFDVLNPSSNQSAGQNQFTIYNFTGTSNLAPDFPSTTDIVFQNATVNVGAGPIDIGEIDSSGGGFQPSSLTFLSTQSFSSATFEATLSTTNLQLAGGTAVTLLSDKVSGVILPSNGNNLTAGDDFAFLTVRGTTAETNVPEPNSASSELTALVVLTVVGVGSKIRRRERRSDGAPFTRF